MVLGHGTGSEFRQPLGWAILGGLTVSQILTLFTTPVIYIYLDGVRKKVDPDARAETKAKKREAEEAAANGAGPTPQPAE